MTLPESLQQIEALFPSTPPSILKSLPVIGCCGEHADDFEWYRDHEWKDLRALVRKGARGQQEGLDPIQFGSLDPIAFHYFVPGVLTGVADYVLAEEARGGQGFDVLFCMTWLSEVVPQVKGVREGVIARHLPLFNQEERAAIRNFLVAFSSHIDEWGPHSDELPEIQKALTLVWK